jgi:glycosyltransferase involved in cell wall biosynthesis
MRVLLVSPYATKVNPYIGLLGDALASSGAAVSATRVLTPAHAQGPDRPDVIHLHWIEGYDRAPARPPRATLAPARAAERALLRLNALPFVRDRRRRERFAALFAELRAFQRSGGRIAYTAHNLDPHEAASEPERRALGEIVALADVLHAHDRATADALAARYGRREGVVVIPHGHYLSAYPNTVTRAAARAALDLPEDGFVYACIGLLRPYKGLEELLPAFNALRDERARLLVAGKAADPRYAQRLAALTGDDPRIRLQPEYVPGEALQLYFNAADIAALPYRQITTSGAAMMAFSFGAPVLAPAIGAFPELLAQGRGLLYEPGDLAAALERARQREWGGARAGILEWVRQFDWSEIGRALLSAYQGGGVSP